ncbi:hypothetical protein HDV00_007849 [Rhizophlyctis rosea]|nr:hypothetical protein HDV00_007849 [Rhizophlyctis rosea]
MMGAAVVTSAVSTALVQWCANPYVTRITIPASSSTSEQSQSTSAPPLLEFETLTYFANPHRTVIPLSALVPASDRHFANWRVKAALSPAETQSLVDMPGLGRMKRRRFYVHQNLDEGFTPEMEKVLEVVKAAGWGGDGTIKGADVGSRNAKVSDTQSPRRDWDSVVKEMREGKKSE